MQELADRPLRVPGEPWPVHAARLVRWVLNLRLVPSRPEWARGWFAPPRRAHLTDALTRPGQVLVWGALMVALLGFRNRGGFPVTGAAIALGAVAWAALAGQILRPRVRAEVRLGGPAVVGLAHRALVDVFSTGRLPAYDLTVRPLRQSALRRDVETDRPLHARLGPGGHTTLAMTVVPRRRGVLRLDGVAVQSYFPFHLTRATTRLAQTRELCVLPAPPAFDLPPLRTLAADLAGLGAQRARFKEGTEYQESRPFQTGDSPLRLDHRASARRGALYTRVHRGSERYVPGGIALVLEPSLGGYARWQPRPRNPDAYDRRVGVAAEIVRRAAAEQLAVRALWLGMDWQAPGDIDAVWRALAQAGAAHAPVVPDSLPPADCLCMLVTGSGHAHAQAWLDQARAAGVVGAVLVVAEGRKAVLPAPRPGTHTVAW